MSFHDRNVLITGAASGIGAAIAEHFCGLGATVALMDYNAEQLDAFCQTLAEKDYKFHRFVADVSNYEQCAQAVEYFNTAMGPMDTLINNAGVSPKHNGKAHKIWEMSHLEWNNVVGINLNGSFNMIRLLVPDMIKHKFGKIINTSSVAANIYLPVVACHYSSTKAAIIGLTRQLAGELGPYGIHVNAVAPGRINTPMVQMVGDAVNSQFIAETPLQRLGQPQEVAKAIEYLASTQSDFVTGQILDVAGGWLMH